MKYFIIDCQLFQTTTLQRGMGRYAKGILAAVQQHEEEFLREYKIVGLYNQNIEGDAWQQKLRARLPDIEFVAKDLEGVSNTNITQALDHNKEAITSYIHSLGDNESFYFVPALLDDTIYACFPDNAVKCKKIVLFHDLIPYIFWERYLLSSTQRERYFYRLKDLFIADIILCNSETTANDLSRFLFISKDKLNVIRSGDPNDFQEKTNTSSQLNRVLLREKKFILSVSGDDLRKNNERAVRAFSKFNAMHTNEYQLVITSRFSEGTIARLKEISDNLIFTQAVSDNDISWLYENAQCLLFVPEYEGLGLPILEAAKKHLKVVASDIEVFRELTDEGAVFVDHTDVAAIANGIEQVTNHKENSFRKAMDTMLNEWSWVNVAKEFAKAISEVGDEASDKYLKKIAVVAPNPSGMSSIGKFVQEHHAYLASSADVTYYLERSPSTTKEKVSYLEYVGNCREVYEFPGDAEKDRYDEIIYHVGNSDFHLATFQYALVHPGTVVLHDTNLTGLAGVMKSYGIWDLKRYEAEARLNDLTDSSPKVLFGSTLVNSAKKVVVHSNYAAEAVRNVLVSHKDRVKVLQHPMTTPIYLNRQTNDLLNIGLAGIINAAKGTDILEQILKNKEANNGAVYHMFGYSFASNIVDILSLYKAGPILLDTDLTDFDFQNKLRTMDVLLNYRPHYHGESSRATLEAMRYGVIPIVRNIGWFSQLPDMVAIKVDTPQEIPTHIRRLIDNRELLERMSKAAVEYINSECSVEQYVSGLISERS